MPEKSDAERRAAFAAALEQALATNVITRTQLADALGVTESAISYWTTGRRLPEPLKIFRLEELLQTGPGQLSRHLGYLPLSARSRTRRISPIEAINSCTGLSPESKSRVIDFYTMLLNHDRQMAEIRAEANLLYENIASNNHSTAPAELTDAELMQRIRQMLQRTKGKRLAPDRGEGQPPRRSRRSNP